MDRDRIGFKVQCYRVPATATKNPSILQWFFRGFCALVGVVVRICQKTCFLTQSQSHPDSLAEHQIADEIQKSFLATFCDQPDIPRLPKYYFDTARNPIYTPGCSSFFVCDKESWLQLNPATRQSVFERRHILIKGLVPEIGGGLEAAFDSLGIDLAHIVEMHGKDGNRIRIHSDPFC